MDAIAIFFTGMLVGAIFELLVNIILDLLTGKPLRVNHRLNLTKRISMVSLPLWGLFALALNNYTTYALLFLVSALAGTAAEWFLGTVFYRVFGIKIWTYHHGAIGEFTSIYSFPYWGGAIFFFWILIKNFGL